MTEKKLNVLQRLSKVQDKCTYIEKEKKQGMRYSIVSHDAVTAKVRPLMVEHGVLYYPVNMYIEQVGNRTQARITVRFVNVDDPKDYIDCESAGYGIDDQDKGPGKAISYAVKYAVLKTLGLESGDDPDKDQEAELKDPANPHNRAIAQFLADIEAASDKPALAAVAAAHTQALGLAADVFPAKVQGARSAYAAKLHAFKAVGNGATS